jgi:hypothetical protein
MYYNMKQNAQGAKEVGLNRPKLLERQETLRSFLKDKKLRGVGRSSFLGKRSKAV